VREYRHRHFGETSWLWIIALVILACALPLKAATVPASHVVAPDGLFDPSSLVSASEYPSFGADLHEADLHEDEYDGRLVSAFPSATGTLDLLADVGDDPSESGTEGVRRVILLAILFGGVLRYLTSQAFYDWAADVFSPLDGYQK
jgi:hypothetical protein